MSEQPIEMSFENALINRMSTRMGQAAVQIEALQLELEMVRSENEQLRAQLSVEAKEDSPTP